jgi:phosphatidylserine/phosphatidylglycerophosphate/cardiolipin synthase-like enzyme
MDILGRLETTISRIINECKGPTVERMIVVIQSELATRQTTVYEWSRLMMPHSISSPLLADFVDAWLHTNLNSEGLLFGLRTALKTKSQIKAKAQSIELVWTGPYPPSTGNVRSTLGVIQEMIASATRQVIMIGYSLTTTTPFPAAVINQLTQAMIRGCEIRIALHDDGYNYWNLKQVWPKNAAFTDFA